ncbi:uncharacterized protein BO88DRAFT_180952 [Aspergillus vadensis CBS 113365]|uniref:Uncharacterized protein n=1 Tax=Aspergillus vadensis (strain CBS 113365 / IMI 142717 / IBT 24658) TaxID=1448311 RepID=A0A319AXZ4_ASPVC|nr:hypothetical protein BO88DRAFT_180952 [Aspergillus vadensis CBS 113365]PYH64291.1 hypothetical protein BO88DRAFT_180952 [Aspergillus vadensis CBS 113365]
MQWLWKPWYNAGTPRIASHSRAIMGKEHRSIPGLSCLVCVRGFYQLSHDDVQQLVRASLGRSLLARNHQIRPTGQPFKAVLGMICDGHQPWYLYSITTPACVILYIVHRKVLSEVV